MSALMPNINLSYNLSVSQWIFLLTEGVPTAGATVHQPEVLVPGQSKGHNKYINHIKMFIITKIYTNKNIGKSL